MEPPKKCKGVFKSDGSVITAYEEFKIVRIQAMTYHKLYNIYKDLSVRKKHKQEANGIFSIEDIPIIEDRLYEIIYEV